MIRPPTPRRRPLRTLAALAATLAILAAAALAAPAAAPAAATELRCKYDGTFNACLSFKRVPNSWYDAHVGIDFYMPEQYGREIITPPCNPQFRASLRGDDGKGDGDPVIRQLWLEPGWPIADSTGIAAEFIGPGLSHPELDEDDDDHEDELYASVTYRDCHSGRYRTERTGIVRGDF